MPSATSWDGDLPGTSFATAADILECAETLEWHKPRGKQFVRIHPPRGFAQDFLIQMRSRYSARVLTGVCRVPVIEENGTVRFEHGHDASSGLFHDRTITFDVPETASLDDARTACQELLQPFSEYNFPEAHAGRAVTLALLFTAILRPFLPTAPMFVVRSSLPGTGKGLVARSAAWLAYGTLPTVVTWGGSGEEFEKRLASLMLQTPAFLNVDNANGMLIAGDLLESLITEGAAEIRPLGRSETIRVRNRSFLCLTGNNPIVTGDMARRTIPLDLRPKSADPENFRFSFNPFEMIKANRVRLLRAAYTAMRAYRLAGSPEFGLPSVGSFEIWARQVRDLVYWLTQHDVADAFRRNKAEDPRRQGDAALLAALHAHFASSPFSAADAVRVYQQAADALRSTYGSPPHPAEKVLHDALNDVLGTRQGVNAKLFGYWARRVRGAPLGGYRLETMHDQATNANTIMVQQA